MIEAFMDTHFTSFGVVLRLKWGIKQQSGKRSDVRDEVCNNRLLTCGVEEAIR